MTHSPENWKATEAQVEAFTNATSLAPAVVLDAITAEVVASLDAGQQVEALYQELRSDATCDYVCGRSALVFENNSRFRKQMTAADPRPLYYAFVRHWVAGIIQAKFPTLFRQLPSSFSVGVPL